MVDDMHRLFEEPAPGITAEQATALIAHRHKAARQLVDQLADLGSGGARAIADVYQQTETLRDRLLLAEVLGKVQDPEAVTVISELVYGTSEMFEQKALVTALAHRQEPQAVEVLSDVLAAQWPTGVRLAAVQGLAGRPAALDALSLAIRSDADQTMRAEAIRSLGLIGDEAAGKVLLRVAQDTELEAPLRQTAIQEMRRSFGSGAQATLEALSQDTDPIVRQSAGQALSMLRRNPAVK